MGCRSLVTADKRGNRSVSVTGVSNWDAEVELEVELKLEFMEESEKGLEAGEECSCSSLTPASISLPFAESC